VGIPQCRLACPDRVFELLVSQVGEPDRGWPVVTGRVVFGCLELVPAGAPAFDDAGAGAVADGVEVLFPGHLGHRAGEELLSLLRGKGRADGPADDADGLGEADPAGVGPGGRGGVADQGADRPGGQEIAPDLLPDQVRAAGPQDPPRSAQDGLDLRVRGLVLPPGMVGRAKDRGRGGLPAGDGGDQGDQPVLAVPAGDLVLHHPDVPGHAGVQVLPAAGRLDQAALDGRLDQDGPVRTIRQQFQDRQPDTVFHPPQQVSAGTGGRAPVVPAVEQPVREQQPAFLQPRVQRPGQGLLPAALGRRRAHRRKHRAREPHSQTVTRRTFGNGPSFAPAPNASRFAGVSGTSSSVPSTDISRHGPRNAPSASSPATGSATCANNSATGSGSRCRACVTAPFVGGSHRSSHDPHDRNAPVSRSTTSS
jgi:hypothetical protein